MSIETLLTEMQSVADRLERDDAASAILSDEVDKWLSKGMDLFSSVRRMQTAIIGTVKAHGEMLEHVRAFREEFQGRESWLDGDVDSDRDDGI